MKGGEIHEKYILVFLAALLLTFNMASFFLANTSSSNES